MSGPVVSVIVPSYNHAQFLEQRLESILNQTFQDFELIILDDVSPDHSREIIENYRNYPKVSQMIFNGRNSDSTFFQWNKPILEKYLIYKNTILVSSTGRSRGIAYIAIGKAELELKIKDDRNLLFQILLKKGTFYTSEKVNNFSYYGSTVIAKESIRKGNRISHKNKIYEFMPL
ncbi:glycosyltransferase family 2 protein [Acinetobacter pollinis]|uniref:Glycosyltransferase family 2 protein n=1 Tax=Acinetobacter pollinis TaxID=2605270 RepID=A0ABU6DVD3_9GAMM|nr:glycosyltransferase family 2 protein [Acinetobacter pollinis]